MQWGNYEQLELVDYLNENFGEEKTQKENKKKTKAKRLIVKEEEKLSFFDPVCEKLYKMIKLSSADVGFSWPTGMLYGRLLQILIEAREEENEEGLKNSIYRIRYPEELWNRILQNQKEIEAILSEYVE